MSWTRARQLLDDYGIEEVRQALRLYDLSERYYEAHVTISPVFGERRAEAEALAVKHGFRLAELLMVKDRPETAQRSNKDTFMTGHSNSFKDLNERMKALLGDLMIDGFDIWRYKIEDTLIDSRGQGNDIYGRVTPKEGRS